MIWWNETGGELEGVAMCVDVQSMGTALAAAHFMDMRTETQMSGREEER